VIVDDENANRHSSGTVSRRPASSRLRASEMTWLETPRVAVAASVRAADQ
jgi:hypothetical protein